MAGILIMRNKLDQTTDARIAEAAKQCACGAHGAIMLHTRIWTSGAPDNLRPVKMPACGPCAVALLEQGWTTEREGN